jgi:hypothetical protein
MVPNYYYCKFYKNIKSKSAYKFWKELLLSKSVCLINTFFSEFVQFLERSLTAEK